MTKIYLACPYSHPNPNVCAIRFELACRAAAYLMDKGHVVFSPISHSHHIAIHLDNSLSHDFWLNQDRAFLDWADEICVLQIPGWDQSTGIQWEKDYMAERGKPLMFLPWDIVLQWEKQGGNKHGRKTSG